MKQIAIVTLFDNVNIGNKLQNYALQEAIKQEGFSVRSIVCRDLLFQPPILKCLTAATLAFLLPKAKRLNLFLCRKKRFQQFTSDYLTVGETVSFDDAEQQLTHYDKYVVGSDQVWHNWKKSKEELAFFFLRFAPKEKRICYAPSFGFDVIEDQKEASIYKEGLNGFSMLCCREQSGCALIEKLTSRKATQVCDPTMLLTAEEWERIAKKPEYQIPERFMLVYFLAAVQPKMAEEIRLIATKKNLAIIDIYDPNKKDYYLTRPDEFLYLISRAQYVCTDSFHCSVFSVLFHRPFHSFSRNDKDGSRMSNRIRTLLDTFHIQLEDEPGSENEKFWIQQFNQSDKELSVLRMQGQNYLHCALQK